jgi:hypothetical protein
MIYIELLLINLPTGDRVLSVLKLAVPLLRRRIHELKPLMQQGDRHSVQPGTDTFLGS